MSFVRIAARIALVEALKGKTLVLDNVLDSEIGALEVQADGSLRTEKEKPFIAVYTDDGKIDKDVDLRSLKENGLTEISLESGITAAMNVTDPNTGESTIMPGIPVTDANMEFQLDIVGRQQADALTDPNNEWAEIFRKLCFRFVKVERARAANDQDGVRLAGRRTVITAEMIDDPIKGEEISEPFPEFFQLLDNSADTVLVAKSTLMKAILDGANEPWEIVQRRMGMTKDELLALGIGPHWLDENRTTPVMTESTIEIDGREPIEVLPDD